jgi:hypothetical protein
MIETFLPLCRVAAEVDLSAADATAQLNERFPYESSAGVAFIEAFKALHNAGEIADRGELPVEWGRVSKATEETHHFSLDVVHMSGTGPEHIHPTGEASFCVPLEGEPDFEGTRTGWHVLPPGSRHIPEVRGGRMLIVYLLPNGEMEFL